MTVEGLLATDRAFAADLQALRPQVGQAASARNLSRILAGSPIVASHADCGRVQDPYTLRCAPQVIGAVDDALAYVRGEAAGGGAVLVVVNAGDAAVDVRLQVPEMAGATLEDHRLPSGSGAAIDVGDDGSAVVRLGPRTGRILRRSG
jgi:hypothetical protein